MKILGVIALVALAVTAAGCSADRRASAAAGASKTCPAASRAGWQKLANRIQAPVYCPAWLPDPLVGKIGGRWNNIDVVSPDRSYLESFVWQETGGGAAGGEIHVNLRGYPGRTTIPTCSDHELVRGKLRKTAVPCFADARGRVHARGIDATVYTVNQDADQWHVLYAWRRGGSLYALSEHVAPPFTYTKVRSNLHRMLRSLVLVRPR